MIEAKLLEEYFERNKVIGNACMEVIMWLIEKTISPGSLSTQEGLGFCYITKMWYPEGEYAYVNCESEDGMYVEEFIFPFTYLTSEKWKETISRELRPGQFLSWHPAEFYSKLEYQYAGYPHGAPEYEIEEYWKTVQQAYSQSK